MVPLKKEGNGLFNDTLNTFLFIFISIFSYWDCTLVHAPNFKGHYIVLCQEGRKWLINDTLNTFLFTVSWCQTYGKGKF